MPGGCCSCSFWRRCCCEKLCFCCPPGCETGCVLCCRGVQNLIFCIQKIICIIVAIPKRILEIIKDIFCCWGLYILLGLLLALLVALIRLFCDEIVGFLDFIFSSGGGGIFQIANALLGGVVHAWNAVAPHVTAGMAMLVDLEMSIYDQLVEEYGEHRMEQLFLDLVDNANVLAGIVGNVLVGVAESDPADLASTAAITKDVTMTLIERHASLEHALVWSTGPGMAAMLPMLIATSNLLAPHASSASSTASMRKLLAQPPAAAFPANATAPQMMSELHAEVLAREFDYNVLTARYIRDIQKEWGAISHEYDVDGLVHYLKNSNRHGMRQQQQQQQTERSSDISYIRKVVGDHVQQHLRNYMDIQGAGAATDGGRGGMLMRSMGFTSLREMNEHVRSEYGDGWGLVYSIDLYRKLGITSRARSPFQEFIQEMQMTPKQASDYFRSGPGTFPSPTQRRLQQIIPIAGILDCFTSIPPDLLCIVENFLPLPLDAPDWLEPFVDFDCDCDDEDYETGSSYLSTDTTINSFQILKTLIQLLGSIPVVSDLLGMITVPMFIEDTFFIDTPGDAPDPDAIICAILHLDYLMVLLFGGLLLLLLLRALCLALCDMYQCIQDLRVRNEHNKLVEDVLDVAQQGRDNEEDLRKYARESLLNPAVMCYHDPDFYGKEASYWLPQADAIPILRGGPASWYVRKDCEGTPPEQRPSAASRIGCDIDGGTTPVMEMRMSDEEREYAVQRYALRKAMVNVLGPTGVSEERLAAMYRKLYPEEAHYQSHTKKDVHQMCVESLGAPLQSLCVHDYVEVVQATRLPYIYPQHMEAFQDHVHSEHERNVPLVPHHIHVMT